MKNYKALFIGIISCVTCGCSVPVGSPISKVITGVTRPFPIINQVGSATVAAMENEDRQNKQIIYEAQRKTREAENKMRQDKYDKMLLALTPEQAESVLKDIDKKWETSDSNEAFSRQNCPSNINFFRKSAEQGNVIAQRLLGTCYRYGEGVAKNETEAFNWYRKAAEQGSAGAQRNLGYLYYTGKGVHQSYANAISWYRKAADQGDTNAQTILGLMYRDGEGVDQSYANAISWLRKAADKGDADAQYNLGYMYYEGKGLAQSNTEATNWWQKAAIQGHADAQQNLRVITGHPRSISSSSSRSYDPIRDHYNSDYIEGQRNLLDWTRTHIP